MSRLTRRRGGYTLAELLIALVMIGAVGLAVSRLMLGQQRFYQRTNEQMGMRRELRTALSLLPAELRSISSSGGDITSFDTKSITFRSVLGIGVVCARTNTSIDIPPTDMARNALSGWYSQPGIGDTIWAFNDSLSRGAEDDVWTPLRITAVQSSSAYCAGSPYTDATLDASKVRWRFTVTPNVPDSVVAGAAIRFTRSTKYELQQQGTTARYYLARSEYVNGAWSAATWISGPYAAPSNLATSGLRLAMYDSLGAAVTDPTQSRRISRIDLRLLATGLNSSGTFGVSNTTNTDSSLFRIALRNRQ
jgi:type II secretory pathway pseudopilin PulG